MGIKGTKGITITNKGNSLSSTLPLELRTFVVFIVSDHVKRCRGNQVSSKCSFFIPSGSDKTGRDLFLPFSSLPLVLSA
jgi:hypothetical protein